MRTVENRKVVEVEDKDGEEKKNINLPYKIVKELEEKREKDQKKVNN